MEQCQQLEPDGSTRADRSWRRSRFATSASLTSLNDFSLTLPVNKITIAQGGYNIAPFGGPGTIGLNTNIDASLIASAAVIALPISLVNQLGGFQTITGGPAAPLKLRARFGLHPLTDARQHGFGRRASLGSERHHDQRNAIHVRRFQFPLVHLRWHGHRGLVRHPDDRRQLPDRRADGQRDEWIECDLRSPGKVATLNCNGSLYVGDLVVGATDASSAEVTDLNLAGPGNKLTVDINGLGAGSGYDQIYAWNSASLSTLYSSLVVRKSAAFTPPGGSVFSIIKIDPGSFTGLTGTFAGLPDGSTINVGGVPFVIRYGFYGVDLVVPSSSVHGKAARSARLTPGRSPRIGSRAAFLRQVRISSFQQTRLPSPQSTTCRPVRLNSIEIQSPAYQLSGSAISLANGLNVSGSGGGVPTIGLPMTIDNFETFSSTIPYALSASLTVNGMIKFTGPVSVAGNLQGAGGVLAEVLPRLSTSGRPARCPRSNRRSAG